MAIVPVPRWRANRFSQKDMTAAQLRMLRKKLLAQKGRREAVPVSAQKVL